MDADFENVILLSADALRADHLSWYGYDRTTSPNLDSLAGECLRFQCAHSVSSHTREAVPGLLTGRYPDEAIDEGYHLRSNSLASTLSDRGFSTAAFHSNPFVSRAYGYDRGFDTFDDDLRMGQHKLLALAQRALDKLRDRHYARAPVINERALSWIDSLSSADRFFLWNHYMDTHGPYEPPAPHDRQYTNESISVDEQSLYQRAIDDPDSITTDERKHLIDLYDGEIRYLDEYIAEFIQELRQRDLLDQSLLIFTADHGDAFGEHGYYEHPRYLPAELTHVPLFVRPPGGADETISTPVSTLDIAATVAPGSETDGTSLFDLPTDRTVFTQARGEGADESIRRYVARTREAACFCERDRADGSMTFSDCTDRSLRSRLRTHVQQRTRRERNADEGDQQDVNEEVSRRLDALGYKE